MERVKVTVRGIGGLQQYFAGRNEMSIWVSSGTTIRQVILKLGIPLGDVYLVVGHNNDILNPETPVDTDQGITLVPPISGG